MNHSILHDFAPTDPRQAIAAFWSQRHRAERMLAEAKTPADRRDAQFWIDNADRNIVRWQAQLDKAATR